jgi:hypothetical protein
MSVETQNMRRVTRPIRGVAPWNWPSVLVPIKKAREQDVRWRDRARELKAQGWSERRIAAQLGRTYDAVRHACGRPDGTKRKENRRPALAANSTGRTNVNVGTRGSETNAALMQTHVNELTFGRAQSPWLDEGESSITGRPGTAAGARELTMVKGLQDWSWRPRGYNFKAACSCSRTGVCIRHARALDIAPAKFTQRRSSQLSASSGSRAA